MGPARTTAQRRNDALRKKKEAQAERQKEVSDEYTDPGVVTPLMLYQEIRGHRKDTGKQFAAVGSRLAKVEQKVDDLTPKVELACQKANGVKVEVAELKGEKKGSGNVMRYVWPVVMALVGGGMTLLVSFLLGG
jgi:hypothetical protein